MKRTKKLGDHSAVSYPLSKPLSYLTPQVLGASSHPFAVCQTSMPTHHPQPPLHPPPLLMKNNRLHQLLVPWLGLHLEERERTWYRIRGKLRTVVLTRWNRVLQGDTVGKSCHSCTHACHSDRECPAYLLPTVV